MKRKHIAAIVGLMGLAIAAGGFAAAETVGLGRSASPSGAPDATVAVAARQAELDRFERSLRGALDRRPPALPPLVDGVVGTTSSQGAIVAAPAEPAEVTETDDHGHGSDEAGHDDAGEVHDDD